MSCFRPHRWTGCSRKWGQRLTYRWAEKGQGASMDMDKGSPADNVPHRLSIAVWDVPSPAATETHFSVMVGVKCTAGCRLAGQSVTISDQEGLGIGRGALEEKPWLETTALYVSRVQLVAPSNEGVHHCTVEAIPASDVGPLHPNTSANFSFRTARPPEHQVTVMVTGETTGTPLKNTEVNLGIYRAVTNEEGLARLAVPTGNHKLQVWKRGYTAASKTIVVNDTMRLQVEATPASDDDPDAQQVWM